MVFAIGRICACVEALRDVVPNILLFCEIDVRVYEPALRMLMCSTYSRSINISLLISVMSEACPPLAVYTLSVEVGVRLFGSVM